MSTPTTGSGATTATRPTKRPAASTAKKAASTKKSATASGASSTTARSAAPTGSPKAAKPAAKPSAEPVAAPVTPLHEREPREVVGAAGLALAALVADAVEALGRLPRDAGRLREEVRPIADGAPLRLRTELERAERALSEAIDARAPRGREVVDEFVARPEVRELRERAEVVRARLQRALGIAPSDETPSGPSEQG